MTANEQTRLRQQAKDDLLGELLTEAQNLLAFYRLTQEHHPLRVRASFLKDLVTAVQRIPAAEMEEHGTDMQEFLDALNWRAFQDEMTRRGHKASEVLRALQDDNLEQREPTSDEREETSEALPSHLGEGQGERSNDGPDNNQRSDNTAQTHPAEVERAPSNEEQAGAELEPPPSNKQPEPADEERPATNEASAPVDERVGTMDEGRGTMDAGPGTSELSTQNSELAPTDDYPPIPANYGAYATARLKKARRERQEVERQAKAEQKPENSELSTQNSELKAGRHADGTEVVITDSISMVTHPWGYDPDNLFPHKPRDW